MKSVPTARAIGKLLLGIGLFAAATAVATDTVPIDAINSTFNGAAEADERLPPAGLPSRPSAPRWSIERCSVSHQGHYRDGRYRKTRRYYDFDVRVTSNCVYARMECLVRYRALVYEPTNAGSRTEAVRASWWESSQQTLTLKPGEASETRPLGPTRRNAGGYEINCTKVKG